MRRQTPLSTILTAALLFALTAFPCLAQEKADTAAAAPALTPELIDARIKTVEGGALDEAAKARALDAYGQAKAHIQASEAAAEQRARADKLREDAPAEIERLKAEIDAPVTNTSYVLPEDATLQSVEQELANARAALSEAQLAHRRLESELKARPAQREQLPKDIAEARKKLQEATATLSANAPEGQPADLTQALRAQYRTQKRALDEQIAAMEKQLIVHDLVVRIQTAQKELANRRVAQAEKRVKPLEAALDALRRKAEADARRKADEQLSQAARLHPVVEEIAAENKRLDRGLAAKIAALEAEGKTLREQIDALNRDFALMKEKVSNASNVSKAIGLWLRNKRGDIPDVHIYRERIKQRESEGFRIALEKIDWEERVENLADLEDELARVNARLADDTPPLLRGLIEATARELLNSRREMLSALIKNTDDYQRILLDVEQLERNLVNAAESNRQLIDEHVLWIPSAQGLSIRTGRHAVAAFAWLLSPTHWRDTLAFLGADALRHWYHTGPLVLLVVLLIALRPRLRSRLRSRAEAVSSPETDHIGHTLAALAVTAFMALPGPLLLWFLSYRLAPAGSMTPFRGALADALRSAAVLLFPLAFIRTACATKGLVPAHFRWRGRAPRALRRYCLLLMTTLVPLLAAAAVFQSDWQPDDVGHNSLGRLAFIAGMLVLSGVMSAMLRPNGAVVREAIARGQGGWLQRGRYLWYALTTLLPLGLAIAATAGYYYTALQLERRLRLSLFVALSIVLANLLLTRTIFVLRRRLALRRAQEREAERRAEARDDVSKDRDATPGPQPVEELNLYTINVQTRRLLGTFTLAALLVGLWLIWADVLPALRIFNQVELWRTGVLEDGTPVWITLGNAMTSLLIVIVTIAAARNIPGVLEITLLRRLSIDQGARFAIATLARYAMTIIGLALAFKAIGVGWAKVQWLAAAVTFGLGFGLQEIFANFVSGLIILFERPMRLGDVVKVGDTVGTVTRIQIRATTITDRDRHELIVPNKEFVTGRLVNWTLSDNTLRVVVPVGIAYGSDIHLARQTLLDVARACPMIMEDPAPEALFLGFGGSSLDFELRTFIATYDHYFHAIHELHERVDLAFRKAGIVIAFPQRDLHFRSADVPLSVRQPQTETPRENDT